MKPNALELQRDVERTFATLKAEADGFCRHDEFDRPLPFRPVLLSDDGREIKNLPHSMFAYRTIRDLDLLLDAALKLPMHLGYFKLCNGINHTSVLLACKAVYLDTQDRNGWARVLSHYGPKPGWPEEGRSHPEGRAVLKAFFGGRQKDYIPGDLWVHMQVAS